MKVAKWGNSLAIRLPAPVVQALGLKEGDEIEIHVAGAREFGVARKPSREAFLNQLRAYRGRLPRGLQIRPARSECPVVSSTRISLSLSRLTMRRRTRFDSIASTVLDRRAG